MPWYCARRLEPEQLAQVDVEFALEVCVVAEERRARCFWVTRLAHDVDAAVVDGDGSVNAGSSTARRIVVSKSATRQRFRSRWIWCCSSVCGAAVERVA